MKRRASICETPATTEMSIRTTGTKRPKSTALGAVSLEEAVGARERVEPPWARREMNVEPVRPR